MNNKTKQIEKTIVKNYCPQCERMVELNKLPVEYDTEERVSYICKESGHVVNYLRKDSKYF